MTSRPEDPYYRQVWGTIPIPDYNVKFKGGLRLLQQMLEYDPLLSDNLEGFDYFIEEVIPRLLSSIFVFRLDGQGSEPRVVVLTDIITLRPSYSDNRNRIRPLFPERARRMSSNYSCQIMGYWAEFWERDWLARGMGVQPVPLRQASQPTMIMEHPVMVGSKYCHLDGLSDLERQDLGELPSDVGGYFIVGGNECYLRGIEQVRAEHVELYNRAGNTGGPSCSLTLDMVELNSVVVNVVAGVSGRGLSIIGINLKGVNRVHEPTIRGPNPLTNIVTVLIGLADAYDIQAYRTTEEVKKRLAEIATPQTWSKIQSIMAGTFLDAYLIEKDYMSGGHSEFILDQLGILDEELAINVQIREYFETNFMPLQSLTPRAKLDTLTYMTINYAMYSFGMVPLTQRDLWANKRIRQSGEILIPGTRTTMRSVMSQLIEGTLASKGTRKEPAPILRQLVDVVTLWNLTKENIRGEGFISKRCLNVFLTNTSWGGRDGSNSLQAMVKTGEAVARITATCEVEKHVAHRGVMMDARSLQTSQAGIMGIDRTPFNSRCGLVLAKAITCRVSISQDPGLIVQIIYRNSHFSVEFKTGYRFKIFLNGIMIGWTDDTSIRNELLSARRSLQIHRHTELTIIAPDIFAIHTGHGRPVRPLLVVQDNRLTMPEGATFNEQENFDVGDLLATGCLEYVGALEMTNCRVASSPVELLNREKELAFLGQRLAEQEGKLATLQSLPGVSAADRGELEFEIRLTKNRLSLERDNPFTHCEIHAMALLSLTGTQTLSQGHSQQSKNIADSNMKSQIVPPLSRGASTRTGAEIVRTLRGEIPLVLSLFDTMYPPYGENMVIAIVPFRNMSVEDAIVVNSNSRHKLRTVRRWSIIYNIPNNQRSEVGGSIYKLGRPNLEAMTSEERHRYRYLEPNGLPFLNAPMEVGDFLIGVTVDDTLRHTTNNVSRIIGQGESGIVDGILVREVPHRTTTATVIEIVMIETALPIQGDKGTNRTGQKNTFKIASPEEMPRTANGTVADLLFNPFGMKRMTMSMFIEMIAGNYALATGERVPFNSFEDIDTDKMTKLLVDLGFNSTNGKAGYQEIHYLGPKGEKITVEGLCFIGVGYYERLKHMAATVLRARPFGRRDPISKQQSKGTNGGLKVGPHDYGAALAKPGGSRLSIAIGAESSDIYTIVYCANNSCGLFAGSDIMNENYQCPNCKGREAKRYRGSYSLIAYSTYMAGLPGIGTRVHSLRPGTTAEVDVTGERQSDESDSDESSEIDELSQSEGELSDVDDYLEEDFEEDGEDWGL